MPRLRRGWRRLPLAADRTWSDRMIMRQGNEADALNTDQQQGH
jgi:hypothetical protein